MILPTLTVIVKGSKTTVLGERTYRYREGQYLIVSATLPLTAVFHATPEDPFAALGVTLNPAEIATLLLETTRHEDEAIEPIGIIKSNMTADLLDPIVRLVRLLDRQEDIPVLAKSIEREILWRLINGEQGYLVRQIGRADSRLAQVGKAIGLIRDRYSEAIRIQELADVAGMSVSTLNRHFRAITTMSPLQYQKYIRLQEARARLMAEQKDVAMTAFSVGYASASHFIRDYRRLFGASPGRDSTRLRTGGMPPSENSRRAFSSDLVIG